MTAKGGAKAAFLAELASLDEPIDPREWQALVLKNQIRGLARGAMGTARKIAFDEFCDQALQAFSSETIPDDKALLENPAAAPLLLYLLTALARYRRAIEGDRKPPTPKVQAAFAKAFYLTSPRRGNPGHAESQLSETFHAFSSAYEHAITFQSLRHRLAISSAEKAAFIKHYGREHGRDTTRQLADLRKLLRLHGYL